MTTHAAARAHVAAIHNAGKGLKKQDAVRDFYLKLGKTKKWIATEKRKNRLVAAQPAEVEAVMSATKGANGLDASQIGLSRCVKPVRSLYL